MPAYAWRLASRLVVVLALVVVAAALASLQPVRAQAPPPADFAYITFRPGWNLISSGGASDNLDAGSINSLLSGPLYTFQPDNPAYTSTDTAHTTVGFGYWAFFKDLTRVVFDTSQRNSYTVDVPAGQCAMVGNPSTRGSVQVLGATNVFQFSPALNQYIDSKLLGMGRGAFACNYTGATTTVQVIYKGDVFDNVGFPDCCQDPGGNMISNNGKARIVINNDSPAPIVFGLRQADDQGGYLESGDGQYGREGGCDVCPEYAPGAHRGCNPAANTLRFDLPPGNYLLHLQSDSPNEPDVQDTIRLDADHVYQFCFFVFADRMLKP